MDGSGTDLIDGRSRVRDRLGGGDGRPPRPEQILELKICDPAMGSGAFLVEACRQLGDALVEAWRAHEALPALPPDEVLIRPSGVPSVRISVCSRVASVGSLVVVWP